MRVTLPVRRLVGAGKLCAALSICLLFAACGGGSDAASGPDAGHAAPSATANGSAVSAVVEEGADVAAYIGKSTNITISISVSEGAVTALRLLPPATPGWQSADGKLACDSISVGQPCKLRLMYAPKAFAAEATMKLSYSYVDSVGATRNGNLQINYRTLPANAATASLDPAGTVNAVVGAASSVTASFDTSDGGAASALHIDLGALPAGWSGGASAFDCASFGGGNACRLPLSYQPSAAVAQTSFDLAYSYLNSAGNTRSGKLTIAYAAVMPNTVFASIAPAGMAVAGPGASQEVSLSFQPGDGNAARSLKLGAGVVLPEGWTIKSSTLPCDRVDGTGACKLVLTFAPTSSLPPQQLDLGFDYVNAAGQAQHGSASVRYSSRVYRAYVADYGVGSGGVRQCEVAADGSLLNCAQAASTWPAPSTSRVLVSGAHAYVAASRSAVNGTRALSVCAIDADGGLSNCADGGVSETGLTGLALLGQYAYLVSSTDTTAGGANRLTRCTLNDSGLVQQGSCAPVSLDAAGALAPAALTAFDSALYVAALDASNNGASLSRCTLDLFGGTQLQCQQFPIDLPQAAQALAGVTLSSGGYIYLLGADGSAGLIVKCTLSATGAVSGCDGGTLPAGVAADELGQAREIVVIDRQAYLAIAGGARKGILRCPIDEASGALQPCVAAGDTGSIMPTAIALR